MDKAQVSDLPGRRIIKVSGPEAGHFLEGLLSVGVEELAPDSLAYGALLTPQGKIISDMIVGRDGETFFLDVPEAAAADLVRRLTMYKLRAKVDLALTDDVVLIAAPGAPADPRHPDLGARTFGPSVGTVEETVSAYTQARIKAGVPEAGIDFALGDAFPHDANMDITGGVDFAKGCFVGQEVVSRMRHRGTARRRTVIISADNALPPSGTALTVGAKPVGTLGTVHGRDGLAIVRVDRVEGTAEADGTPVRLKVPDGAPFSFAAAAEG